MKQNKHIEHLWKYYFDSLKSGEFKLYDSILVDLQNAYYNKEIDKNMLKLAFERGEITLIQYIKTINNNEIQKETYSN